MAKSFERSASRPSVMLKLINRALSTPQALPITHHAPVPQLLGHILPLSHNCNLSASRISPAAIHAPAYLWKLRFQHSAVTPP